MKPQTYWQWSFLVNALLLTFLFPVLVSLLFALLFFKYHDIINLVIIIGFYTLIVPSLLTTIIATIFALAMRLYRERTSTFIISTVGIYASFIYGIFIFDKPYSQMKMGFNIYHYMLCLIWRNFCLFTFSTFTNKH